MEASETRDPQGKGTAGQHQVLPDVPIFRLMPDNVRGLVMASLEPVSFPYGTVITAEGDEADALYVILAGSARVLKQGRHGDEVPLGLLGPGDHFGEVALLEDGRRTATVRARGEIEALRLDRSVFRALVRSHPEFREYFEAPVRLHHLRDFVRLESSLAGLSPEAVEALLPELDEVRVGKGETILQQGRLPGPMYLVREGRVRLHRDEGLRHRDVAFLRRGDLLGHTALLTGGAQPDSAEALDDCRLIGLSAESFRKLCADHPAFAREIEAQATARGPDGHARVPLDFADEILPAASGVYQAVGPDQVDQEPAAEDAETDGRFRKPEKRIRRFPHVWQVDEADCGAACVAMLCRHFGRDVSLAHIRHLVQTSTDGTSLSGITRGAEEVGLAARAVKASKGRLEQLPLPAVVHWEGNHWVVLYDVEDGRVRVADPARGLKRLKRDEFDEKWSGYAAYFAATPELENAPEAERSVAWLWQFFRPHRGTMAKAALLALVAAGFQMAIPIFSKVIVDTVIADRDFALLNVVILAMLAVLVAMIAASTVQRYLLSRTAVEVDGKTLDFLTDKLFALPMSYFNARRTGDIEQRLAGMRQVRQFVVQNGVLALTAVTQLLAALALMFVFSPVLALVYLATVPLYAALMRFSRKRLRPLFDGLEESFGRYQSRQIDAIKGIETVKTMGAEPALRRLLLGQWDSLSRRVFRSDFTIMLYEGAIQMVTLLSLALFLFVGARQVLAGNLTIGGLVSFQALVVLANQPVQQMLSLWDQLQQSSVLLNRLNDIFEQDPEQGEDHSHLTRVTTLEGRVRLENLGFRYGGPSAPAILEGISFDVEPGTTVAIVGRSGSGKTTLVKCLAGLLEPTEGAVYHDGFELRTLDYRDLRRQIGFVLQENYLFDETIANNVAFGDEEPDMGRVIWAARVASAHDFIERLPLGYDTRVGETGLLLSGGQRQRVAIARALYNRPPVLIFDEATSSLDTESERALKENMNELLEGRTSFVIAHRLSTIRDADVIVVLEQGRLVEQGSHDELMERRGLYHYLNSQQLSL